MIQERYWITLSWPWKDCVQMGWPFPESSLEVKVLKLALPWATSSLSLLPFSLALFWAKCSNIEVFKLWGCWLSKQHWAVWPLFWLSASAAEAFGRLLIKWSVGCYLSIQMKWSATSILCIVRGFEISSHWLPLHCTVHHGSAENSPPGAAAIIWKVLWCAFPLLSHFSQHWINKDYTCY